MRVATSLALVLALASCSHRDPEQTAERTEPATNPATRADGDVRIVSTGGEVDLALVGDTISSGLSEQTLTHARRELDTGAVSGNGIGASIERAVKGTVQSALGTRVTFPVSSLRDARYESGKIVFDWKERPIKGFVKTSVNGKPFLESFAPDDAERFVSAVRARIAARR